MAQSEKDKVVDALFAQLQKKKAQIAKTERSNWLTNCSFSYNREGGSRINLQTISDVEEITNMLASLLESATAYNEAKRILNTEGTFKWLGFTVDEWTADFQTRINKISVAKLKKEYEVIEARIDKLVSVEKREEMEIAALSKELGLSDGTFSS